MGDPRKIRKTYQTPGHPWNSERIAQEKEILGEYGLVNKKEIWKMEEVLKNAKTQAKALARTASDQARKEEKALLDKLSRLGIISEGSTLDSILALEIRSVLERRLQTVLFKQMKANSMKQARQFIVHGHVSVDGKKITSPSYFVSLKEEGSIDFHPNSTLSNPEHPERTAAKTETPEEVEAKARAIDAAKAEEATGASEDKPIVDVGDAGSAE